MKFKCRCGHIVVDRDSDLPYKGEIIRDQSYEDFYEKSSLLAGEFIKAINEGRRQDWIKSFYEGRDLNVSDSGVISDIYCRASVENGLNIFQCESCGRIFIEKHSDSNAFVCFKPVSDDWKGVLEVKK